MVESEVIEIGHIVHFFSRINVAIVDLMLPLSIGDRIIIKGPSTDFEQIVNSMQIDFKEIQRAEGGQNIGLKVIQPTKEKDVVFKKV